MKFCCKKKRKEEPAPVVVEEPAPAPIPEPVKEDKFWTVNCPKCGAALSLREGALAHMCPVCNTLLQLKKRSRMVKDEQVSPAEEVEETETQA